MDKQHYNKGFTILEGLLILGIIGYFTTSLTIIPYTAILQHMEVKEHLERISLTQFYALLTASKKCYETNELYTKYPICFNQNGNSNMAQSINVFKNKVIVIHLGSGTHEIK